jgi:hypothetical protein
MSQQPDTRVRIVQCLCPKRHCIMATAYTPADITDDDAVEEMRDSINSMIARGVLDPWCGICAATDWHYEVGQTAFATMEVAAPDRARKKGPQSSTEGPYKNDAAYYRTLYATPA